MQIKERNLLKSKKVYNWKKKNVDTLLILKFFATDEEKVAPQRSQLHYFS